MWAQISDGGAVNLNNVFLLRAHTDQGVIKIATWNENGTVLNFLKGSYPDVAAANEVIRELVNATDPETYGD